MQCVVERNAHFTYISRGHSFNFNKYTREVFILYEIKKKICQNQNGQPQVICELENRIQISFIFVYIHTNYHMNILCQNCVSLGIVRQVDICLLQLQQDRWRNLSTSHFSRNF